MIQQSENIENRFYSIFLWNIIGTFISFSVKNMIDR